MAYAVGYPEPIVSACEWLLAYMHSGPCFAKAEFSLDERVWAAESLVGVVKQTYLVISLAFLGFDLCWDK